MRYLYLIILILASIYAKSQCNIDASVSNSVICPGQSVTLSATGGCGTTVNMSNTFDNGTIGTGWSTNMTAMFNNPCGVAPPYGTTFLWLGHSAPAPRYLTTQAYNTSGGGNISFWFRWARQPDIQSEPCECGTCLDCEGPDEKDEGVSLQYSVDNGTTWADITYFCPDGQQYPTNQWAGTTIPVMFNCATNFFTTWRRFSFPMPPASQSLSTRFRWAQSQSTDSESDHWGIDSVLITTNIPADIVWFSNPAGFTYTGPNPPPQTPNATTQYIATAACGGTVNTPLFANYDFEAGSTALCGNCPTGYTCVNDAGRVIDGIHPLFNYLTDFGCVTSGSNYTNSLGAHSGTGYVFFYAGSDKITTGNYTFAGGEQVEISAWYAGPQGNGPSGQNTPNSHFKFGIDGLAVSPNINVPTNTVWTKYTYTATMTAGSHNFSILTGWAAEYAMWFDDFSVKIVDSPSTSCSDIVTVTVNNLTADAGNNVNICGGSSTQLQGSGGEFYSWFPTTGLNNALIANPVATPSVTTKYYLSVANSDGCSAVDSVTVFVDNSFTVNAGNDQSICTNGQAVITAIATGAISYHWSNNINTATQTVNPINTTTYIVTATNAGNCIAKDTVIVTVNALPLANAGLDQTICPSENATLTASGGIGFVWSDGLGNTASVLASPNTTTTYTVTVIDANNCTASDNVIVTVSPLLNITAMASSNSICIGESVNINATGATSYLWDNGNNTSSFTVSPTATTTYTVTGTTGACSGTGSVTIIVNPLPNANAGSDKTICLGQNATLTASGGTNYQWSGALGNTSVVMATPVINTQYIVTVTNNNGCFDTDTVIVNVNALPIASAGTDQTICLNGSATLTASGGSNYVWDDGQITATITVSPTTTTTYTVVVTDNNGCYASDQVVVTIDGAVVLNISSNDTICPGGSAQLNVSGANTYSWSPAISLNNNSIANPIASPNSTTLYTVTGTNINGCTATAQVEVFLGSIPVITINGNDTICSSGNSQLQVSGGVQYLWSSTGSLNNANISNPVVSPVNTTMYYITVTNSYGCSSDSSILITVLNPIVISTTDVPACANLCNGKSTATVSGGSGAFSYLWDNGSTTNIASNLCSGAHSLTVSDYSGCQNNAVAQINIAPGINYVLSHNDVLCSGQINGSASVQINSAGNHQILWSNNISTTTISQLAAGTYSVTITNDFLCTVVDFVTIDQPLPLNLSIQNSQNPLCNNDCNGIVQLQVTGGTAPYIYQWSDGGSGANRNNLCGQAYSVTVKDNNNCEFSIPVILNNPSVLNVQLINLINPTCSNNCDGEIFIQASGGSIPYTYHWSNNESTSAISQLCEGDYTLNITDLNNCSLSKVYSLLSPNAMSVNFQTTDVKCNGDNNGEIHTTLIGGTAPYTFVWSNGQNSINNIGVEAGNYIVTVTDNNNCKLISQISINEPEALHLTISQSITKCENEQTIISSFVTGGTAPYTYFWNGVQGQNIFQTNAAGNYSCYVIDANLCQSNTAQNTISNYPALQISVNVNPDSICPGEQALIHINVSGGNGGPYEIRDASNQIVQTSIIINPTLSGNYSYSVSDGCSFPVVGSTSIFVYPQLNPQFSSSVVSGCEPLYVKINANNIPPNSTITWFFGDDGYSTSLNPEHYYETAGLFDVTLTITDNNGCKSTITKLDYIEVYPTPEAKFVNNPYVTDILHSEVYFDNLSQGASSYIWYFGDGAISNIENPQHSYSNVGKYDVMLIAFTEHNCKDTAISSIVTHDIFTFYVPNAFSPDGDGVNDFFNVFGHGISPDDFQLLIYDRWGELIYKTNDMNKSWDGTVNGDGASIGSYAWLVQFKDFKGINYEKAGMVTLIR